MELLHLYAMSAAGVVAEHFYETYFGRPSLLGKIGNRIAGAPDNLSDRGGIINLSGRLSADPHTLIEMVEYDLAPQNDVFGSQWERAFRKWLSQGAHIDIFVQGALNPEGVHPDSLNMVRDFKRKYQNLSIYHFLGIPYSALPSNEHGTIWDNETFHFTLSHNPDRLWLERNHQKGSQKIEDWEFSENPNDPRMSKLEGIITILRKHSHQVI